MQLQDDYDYAFRIEYLSKGFISDACMSNYNSQTSRNIKIKL